MPIASTDIKFRLSGGASNADPLASLGGAKSDTEAGASIFDSVSGAESASGDIEYRCIYVHNAHASLTLEGAVAWVASNTPSPSTSVDIGVGTSTVNATEQGVANDGAAPAGVAFSAAATQGAGVVLGDIPAGQHRAVWMRRTVTAGAAALADGFTIRATGSTEA